MHTHKYILLAIRKKERKKDLTNKQTQQQTKQPTFKLESRNTWWLYHSKF